MTKGEHPGARSSSRLTATFSKHCDLRDANFSVGMGVDSWFAFQYSA
jgi:hypothetical protein